MFARVEACSDCMFVCMHGCMYACKHVRSDPEVERISYVHRDIFVKTLKFPYSIYVFQNDIDMYAYMITKSTHDCMHSLATNTWHEQKSHII